MKTETTGTLVDGVVQLDEAVDLPNHSRVSVIVKPLASDPDTAKAALVRFLRAPRSGSSTRKACGLRGTNCMNAVDTNVFVYAIDQSDPAKHGEAQALLGGLQQASDTVLPWQVAGEYLNCLRRFASTGQIPATGVEPAIQDLLSAFPLALPTENVISLSLSLTSQHSLSHWDSMLLAACIEAGVDTLYSEDFTDGAVYDTVTVVNPFS